MDIIQPKDLTLHKALKIGYLRNQKKQKKRLKKFGYRFDPELSNERQNVVAFNPTSNKLLLIGNGTDPRQEKDLQTDLLLGIGGLKETERYREEKNALLKAKRKYKEADVVIVGHSLYGGIANSIASPNDSVVTLDPALTNPKPRRNVTNYRTKGDIVSAFASNTTTLPNPNQLSLNPIRNILNAHNVDNIRNQPIFI